LEAVLIGFKRQNFRHYVLSALLLGTVTIAGCGTSPKEAADAQSQPAQTRSQGATPVEVAIATLGKVAESPEYTGSTFPDREVSLRAQVEGRVRSLFVDVGDVVKKGQIVAQLDDTLLRTTLNQAQAELASLKAEVARAQNQVSNAKTEVERAKLELAQAQSDSGRQQRLLKEGAIAAQEAEQARTTASSAAQAVLAAQKQVRTEQQTVAAAQNQVNAQQAVVASAREQLSYTRITSPIAGTVTQRLTEAGNLAQPNGEILRIGDFGRIQVNVEVSELELVGIQLGQSVAVRLDAFPGRTFKGQVSRISPTADPTARLVPIEVIIPNTDRRISSGLLARVRFGDGADRRVVVPEAAISKQRAEGAEGAGEKIQNPKSKIQNQIGTVFVVSGGENNSQAMVAATEVKLGERADGKVEILSGLKPGDRFVAESGKPLKDGETVRLSILSQTAQQGRS
jgi:RND family efflux transporter MFP subunit